MLEVCRHCNGECYVKKRFCEFCGGCGVNTWLGNMMGKPDRSVNEVVRETLNYFRFDIQDKKTLSEINKMLEGAFQNTKIIVELESFDKTTFNLKVRKRIRG
jgi:hypothetical protein